jgi:hypothetical protein
MTGRDFLNVARVAVEDLAEEWQRTAASRGYYALFLECRDAVARWGFAPSSIYQAHAAIRNRLLATNHPDLKSFGRSLADLFDLRAQADYDMLTPFAPPFQVELYLDEAEAAIALLDETDNDPGKRAAAIAALQGVP